MIEREDRQHTPGPWQICPTFGGNRNAISIIGDDSIIATVWDRDAFGREHDVVANASLIISAPDLYDYVAQKALEGDQKAQTLVGAVQALPSARVLVKRQADRWGILETANRLARRMGGRFVPTPKEDNPDGN